ncbi:MAG: prephenate dehydratase [Pseudomonadota bacterium]|nr:prephenate dehydratase [Pseudomonadota bacterium]MDE3037648.1 prephenate dehydratase [Pseudomonadota bacterium]
MSSPTAGNTVLDSENTIAFMGAEGSNSDLACRQAAPYMSTLPCPSFEDVFEAVQSGKAALGIIPIENSQAGRVAEIHQLLPKTNLHIVGEYFQHIEHCLLAPKGATLAGVKEVYSHPQGLLQCRKHLREMKFSTHDYSSTAQAAADVARWNDKTKAAVASPLAGEIYGLQVLKEHLQDADDNMTVFIIIAREPVDPEPKVDTRVLTTLLFTVRNIPAALYKSLGGFATNGVNILKLESYIPGGASRDAAQFFLTCEGHPRQPGVKNALEELGFFCKKVTVLGVYTADTARFS